MEKFTRTELYWHNLAQRNVYQSVKFGNVEWKLVLKFIQYKAVCLIRNPTQLVLIMLEIRACVFKVLTHNIFQPVDTKPFPLIHQY